MNCQNIIYYSQVEKFIHEKRDLMKLKKFTLGAVVAAILAGCGNAADSNTVKIGGNFELTGNVATYGTSMNNGAQLAIKKKGKLLDKELKYVSYDNKSDKTEVASVAKKLASEKVVGRGCFSINPSKRTSKNPNSLPSNNRGRRYIEKRRRCIFSI